jgi:hypothetical protein
MKILALLALASAARAQSLSAPFLRSDPSRIGILPILRSDPPSSPLLRRFAPSLRERTIANGPAFFTRIFLDAERHAYLGYELLIERKPAGAYLATVGKLGVTPMDLADSLFASFPIDLEWTMLPLPAIPERRLLHDGDTLSINLFVDPALGDKLIDEIRINPPLPVSRFGPAQLPSRAIPIPTVSGDPRAFSAADAEMQIVQSRVSLNGTMKGVIGRSVRGSLVWLYLPGHGRYVLSLTPRPGLDFQQAGEVRGGVISFALAGDSIRLESFSPIAAGDSPYLLYVLHDPQWEPTSEKQKSAPNIGTVGAAELSALNQK